VEKGIAANWNPENICEKCRLDFKEDHILIRMEYVEDAPNNKNKWLHEKCAEELGYDSNGLEGVTIFCWECCEPVDWDMSESCRECYDHPDIGFCGRCWSERESDSDCSTCND